MQYFDTHAHYFDDRFYSDECPSGPDALLDGLFAGDICGIVNVATSPANYRAVISQAARYDRMYTALGIHPTDCQSLGADPAQELPALKALLSDPASKAVALGEIGLDYHYDDTDKPRQLAYFHAQLALAQELDLPVIIHDRDAHGDVYEAVCAHPACAGYCTATAAVPSWQKSISGAAFSFRFPARSPSRAHERPSRRPPHSLRAMY